jgi:tetratricopeptide (TPR) repeat protein
MIHGVRASSIAVVLLAVSASFAAPPSPKDKIFAQLEAHDVKGAEASLARWKANKGEDEPEYWIAGANIYFELGHQSSIALEALPAAKDKAAAGKSIVFSDEKTGKPVGIITEGQPHNDMPTIKKAIGYLDEGVRRFPYRLDMFVGRAHLYRTVGDLTGELTALTSLVKDPQARGGAFKNGNEPITHSLEDWQVNMLNTYAREHFEAGGDEQRKDGIAVAKLLTQQFPKRAEGYNLLGAGASMQGDWNEAKRQFEAAMGVAPRDALVVGNLGYCLEQLGDKKGAIAQYEKVVALDNDAGEIERAKSRLTALKGAK